jgi:hypothetical protein
MLELTAHRRRILRGPNENKQRTNSSNQYNILGKTIDKGFETKSNFANNYIKPLNIFR